VGWRFRRTMKILPGVRLNFSRSGVSWSVGVRGLRLTLGGKTGPRTTVGLPGSGISYTKTWPKHREIAPTDRQPQPASLETAKRVPGGGASPRPELPAPAPKRPSLLGKLVMPAAEQAFAEGLYALWNSQPKVATKDFAVSLQHEPRSAEGHYLAGLAQRELDDVPAAIDHLENALDLEAPLPGPWIAKHAAGLTYELVITENLTAQVPLDEVSAALTLVELYQSQNRLDDAIAVMEELVHTLPDEHYVRLSLAELYSEGGEYDHVIQLLAGVQNEDDATLACLFYYTQALIAKGLYDAALSVIAKGLRKSKGRDPELLKELQYAKGLAYEGQGKVAQARREFERLYATDPNFRDVAERVQG